MSLKPINRMWERVEIAREDSDTALFYALLKLGELVTKAATAGMIAGVQDDRERHRYRLTYNLVRSDGLGDWSRAMQEVTKPPVVEQLTPAAKDERDELTHKQKQGAWQFEALETLKESCRRVGISEPDGSATGWKWLDGFAYLRNKTSGHGAQPEAALSKASYSLERSIKVFVENFALFKRPWAHLQLSQSGKYRVAKISGDAGGFEALRNSAAKGTPYEDGVYVHFDRPERVELLESDPDLLGFYFPNGNFNGKRFEMLAYDTGDTHHGDAAPYMVPPIELPASHTSGGELYVVGDNSLTNMPPGPVGYVDRYELERELSDKLTSSRHEVLTLSGRGGIGKTSLTLSVLHDIAKRDLFSRIIWFSARDVDLLTNGPKKVKADVLSARDIAKQFAQLMSPPEAKDKGFDAMKYFCESLERGAEGESSLFVFDNFETVTDKQDVYNVIDTYIRAPNKALITTRERNFRGDYAIEVRGMTDGESRQLIDSTSADLDIAGLLTLSYRQQLYRESEGHPYVIKILLGEVAKSGQLSKVPRIMASQEQILEALFERTYNKLSPSAQRVFLGLSSWRSVVPQLALEAVLLRDTDSERIGVEDAIEELHQSSFVEIKISEEDNEPFVFVPLTASLFGQRMLPTSPFRNSVQADIELLQKFGATQQTDIPKGIERNINALFRDVERNTDFLDTHMPMLEIVARRYPPAWRRMVALYERSSAKDSFAKAKGAVEQYLQLPMRSGDEEERREAWRKLAGLRSATGDLTGEVYALLEMCRLSECPIEDLSYSARRVLDLLRMESEAWDRDERRLVAGELARRMERRTAELYPNDYGYLAWLLLNSQEEGSEERARKFTKLGLRRNPNNEHLNRLAQKLML